MRTLPNLRKKNHFRLTFKCCLASACLAIAIHNLGSSGESLRTSIQSVRHTTAEIPHTLERKSLKDGDKLAQHPRTSTLTQCWLDKRCQPMLYSVKIIDDRFHVLFTSVDLISPDQNLWNNGEYTCNGVSDGVELSNFGEGLVVKCPESIHASNDVLRSVTVQVALTDEAVEASGCAHNVLTNGTTTGSGNGTVVLKYDTALLDKCEREDIRYHEGRRNSPPRLGSHQNENTTHSNNTFSSKIRAGIHAVFVGDRQKAFHWAAYHHLIGFEHVWLYVNDDWDDAKGLIHADYITWIPFKFRINDYHYVRKRKFNPMDVFRVVGQNDALWRAKRMGLNFFAAMDFDEYIRIDNVAPSSNETFGASLEAFGPGLTPNDLDSLPNYLAAFQNRLGGNYLGIRMNSIFFGRGPQNQTNQENVIPGARNNGNNLTSLSLDIDYDWRQRGDPGKFHFTRFKNLLNVTCNDYVNIHYQKKNASCSSQFLWKANANDLRFNHYKAPLNGVFWKGVRKVHPTEKVEKDTSLIDEYRDKLVSKILRQQSLQIQY